MDGTDIGENLRKQQTTQQGGKERRAGTKTIGTRQKTSGLPSEHSPPPGLHAEKRGTVPPTPSGSGA